MTMTMTERLSTRSYHILTMYIYDGDDDNHNACVNVEPEYVEFDWKTITLFVSEPTLSFEITVPYPASDDEIIWDEESGSYEYVVDGRRYVFYF